MSSAWAIAYPEDADYAISEEEHDRLWRVQQAAILNHEVATHIGINHDGVSTVADYIREGLPDIASSAKRLREPVRPLAQT
ncbi:hypothetical protein [Xanthomonas oryzae]|uniref:hypothetical protein n=1 Tax=Xanthomonas oryzae TaxID=347 RepID=UPI001F0DFBCD|nr:hypothetical protein [Xanthomonas oryzae]